MGLDLPWQFPGRAGSLFAGGDPVTVVHAVCSRCVLYHGICRTLIGLCWYVKSDGVGGLIDGVDGVWGANGLRCVRRKSCLRLLVGGPVSVIWRRTARCCDSATTVVVCRFAHGMIL